MDKPVNLLIHEDRFSLATLPDGWTGLVDGNSRIILNNDTEEYFLSLEKKFIADQVKNLTLFSGDNYMSMGLRRILENVNNIRLRVENAPGMKSTKYNFDNCEMIILVESEMLKAVDIINLTTLIRKNNDMIRIIVVAEESYVFFNRLSKIWNGFVTVNSRTSLQLMEKTIKDVLKTNIIASKIESVFTSRQWRTLSLLALGLNMSIVGHIMKVSEKTVSLHKKQAFERIGINNRVHQAWLMNAIKSYIDVIH